MKMFTSTIFIAQTITWLGMPTTTTNKQTTELLMDVVNDKMYLTLYYQVYLHMLNIRNTLTFISCVNSHRLSRLL